MISPILKIVIFTSIISSGIACEGNATEWQGDCYTFHKNSAFFGDAEDVCSKAGGHLVSIHDSFTNAFLQTEAKEQFPAETSIWIGGIKLSPTWTWSDNTNFDFVNWKANYTGGEIRCAALDVSTGLWVAEKCSDTKLFACKALKPNPPTSPPLCEKDWVYYEGSKACYHLYNETHVEATAEEICQKQGAHLISLHNYEEAEFALAFEIKLDYALWLGLITEDQGQTWKWTDGSPTDFLLWGQGYPMPLNHNSCGVLVTQDNMPAFINTECNYYSAFICKKPSL